MTPVRLADWALAGEANPVEVSRISQIRLAKSEVVVNIRVFMMRLIFLNWMTGWAMHSNPAELSRLD